MDINDRSFGGEVFYQQYFGAADFGAGKQCGSATANHGPRSVARTASAVWRTRRRSAIREQLIGASGVLDRPRHPVAVHGRDHRRLRVRDPRRSQDRRLVPEPPPRPRHRGRLDRRREHVHHREPRRVVDATRRPSSRTGSRDTDDPKDKARLHEPAQAVPGHPDLRPAAPRLQRAAVHADPPVLEEALRPGLVHVLAHRG